MELKLTGVVDPFIASYVKSGIGKANSSSTAAVLITIDTPGGLDSSMRQIVQTILDSRVPVICFTYPAGARAASAGTFIMMACPVAAMAPGTNIGAAHPVGVSGAIEQEKVVNDAVAYIRSLAEQRGRNADWAELAVRDSVSISAQEALDVNVIDLIAPDVPSLLQQVNGMHVQVAHDVSVTLGTAGASVEQVGMNPFFAFLHALLDPNIAFIFFWVGLGLIVLEIFVPGGVLGTIGALMLVCSVVAFGMLPVQMIGVALLVASVVFFVIEVKHPGIGVPAVGGVVCLVLGGVFLFDPSVPNSRVSPWILVLVALLMIALFTVVVQSARRLRTVPPVGTVDDLVGSEATVIRRLHPQGVVRINAEEWTAVSASGEHLHRETRVRVIGVEGLKLNVEPLVDGTPSEAATPERSED